MPQQTLGGTWPCASERKYIGCAGLVNTCAESGTGAPEAAASNAALRQSGDTTVDATAAS